jgi:TRAP-type C4-dicarboxylate transport system substrate-binding protein
MKAIVLAASALAATLAVPLHAQTTARLSYHWGPSHESAQMAKKLADEVTKRSGGKLKIDVFPSGQLYTIRQIISSLSAGSVEMGGVVTHNQIPAVDRDWNVFQLPYTWESIEHQRRFLAESPEGKALRQRVLQKTGMAHVAYTPVGPYVLFSTKDLSTIASMKGLKARALAPSERPGLQARGMSVLSLSTEEISSALQSGMIDTLATVPTAIKAYSWWDHLKVGQLPYAVYADAEVMANGKWLAALPADQRDLLLAVGAEISKEATAQIYKGNIDALKELTEKHGGRLVTLQGKALEDLKALDREKTEPELAKMMSPEIFAAVKRFVGRK